MSVPAARTPIVTGRLVLEPVTLELARAVVAGRYDTLQRGAGWPHPDTIDGLAAFAVAGVTDDDGPWLLVLRTTGHVIGEAGWKGRPGPAGTAEIGYGLAAPYRGRGYATEALDALVPWMLAQPGCERVVAEVLEQNTTSRRLLERVGFTLERQDSPYVWYERR